MSASRRQKSAMVFSSSALACLIYFKLCYGVDISSVVTQLEQDSQIASLVQAFDTATDDAFRSSVYHQALSRANEIVPGAASYIQQATAVQESAMSAVTSDGISAASAISSASPLASSVSDELLSSALGSASGVAGVSHHDSLSASVRSLSSGYNSEPTIASKNEVSSPINSAIVEFSSPTQGAVDGLIDSSSASFAGAKNASASTISSSMSVVSRESTSRSSTAPVSATSHLGDTGSTNLSSRDDAGVGHSGATRTANSSAMHTPGHSSSMPEKGEAVNAGPRASSSIAITIAGVLCCLCLYNY